MRPHPRDDVAAIGDWEQRRPELTVRNAAIGWRFRRFVQRAHHPAERLQSVALDALDRIVSRRFEAPRAPPRGADHNRSRQVDAARMVTGLPPRGALKCVQQIPRSGTAAPYCRRRRKQATPGAMRPTTRRSGEHYIPHRTQQLPASTYATGCARFERTVHDGLPCNPHCDNVGNRSRNA